MDNKTYLDMLIMSDSIELDKDGWIYDKLSNCPVKIRGIMNIAMRHKSTVGDTLSILYKIVCESMDVEVIDSSFKEIYRIFRVYDKYFMNITYTSMIRDIKYTIQNISGALGIDTLHVLLLKYRVKVIYSSKIWIKFNGSKRILKVKDERYGKSDFTINGGNEVYDMIVDYKGKSLLYKKNDVKNRSELLNTLDKDMIDLIIMFDSGDGFDLYRELR